MVDCPGSHVPCGKESHIYGSGKDRVVVCLKRKDYATSTPVANTKPSGTTGS